MCTDHITYYGCGCEKLTEKNHIICKYHHRILQIERKRPTPSGIYVTEECRAKCQASYRVLTSRLENEKCSECAAQDIAERARNTVQQSRQPQDASNPIRGFRNLVLENQEAVARNAQLPLRYDQNQRAMEQNAQLAPVHYSNPQCTQPDKKQKKT
jgi:hypothetical protein